MTLRNYRHGALGALALTGALSAMTAHPAQAQNTVTSNGGRFAVELRDVSLADALQLIFKAAEVPSYQIDPAAQTVYIPVSSFSNASFETIVLNLTRSKNFRAKRDRETGAYVIEPRNPAPSFQNFGQGGGPVGGFAPSPFSTPTTPSNPFGSNPFAGRGTRQFGNQQITPSFGQGAGNENNEYRIVPVRHVYVGGIARLFGDATIIATEDFVVPESGGSSAGSGRNSGNGSNSGGLGGIGGGVSNVGGGGDAGSGGGLGGFGGGDIGGSIGGGDIGGGGGF